MESSILMKTNEFLNSLERTDDIIDKRYSFAAYFFVRDANPNGDPDADNRPRMIKNTDYGYTSSVSFKRRIRDYIELTYGKEYGYRNYVKRAEPLERINYEVMSYFGIKSIEELKEEKKKNPEISKMISDKIHEMFVDTRFWGYVATTFSKANLLCSNGEGTVEIGDSRSVDKVYPQRKKITRCTTATEEDAKVKNNDFGYAYKLSGMYKICGSVYPLRAINNGFTKKDLSILWEAILNMFLESGHEGNHDIMMKELVIFEHDSKTCVVDEWVLYDFIKAQKKDGVDEPQEPNDYDILVPKKMPDGIKCIYIDKGNEYNEFKKYD